MHRGDRVLMSWRAATVGRQTICLPKATRSGICRRDNAAHGGLVTARGFDRRARSPRRPPTLVPEDFRPPQAKDIRNLTQLATWNCAARPVWRHEATDRRFVGILQTTTGGQRWYFVAELLRKRTR